MHHALRFVTFCFFVLLPACSGTSGPPGAPSSSSSRTGLFVSDIHFNPLADPALANALAQAPAAQWDSIFATSTKPAYSQYGADTNFPLLQSALAAMRQQDPNPDIVFISGDFLLHYFQTFFNSRVTNHSPAAYAAFVNTTERYLAMKFAQTFPNAQIVPALGNVDTACGAEFSDGAGFTYAGSDFLTSFSSAWKAAVNRYGGAPDFQATFAAGGYYSTSFPVDPRGRLIVLDTQPWSPNFSDECGPGGATVGDAELGWLTAQLDDARSNGGHVWLLGHIPPGVDPSGGPTCRNSIVSFYTDTYSRKLSEIFAKYRGIIAFGIFAHTHNDDFRVARDSSGNLLFGMKVVPSITPLHSNNPAFVQFTYDPGAGVISDTTTWYLNNISSATTAVPGVWTLEYAFDVTYGQHVMDSNGVADAVTKIKTQTSAQSAFTRYYSSSSANSKGSFATFAPNGCALDNLTVTEYSACLCAH